MFCGSTSDLQVDHLDGYEEHGEPENLLWLCRSCNQLKSAVFKAAGLGRRTKQYNPFLGLFGEGGLLGGRTYRTHTGRAIGRERVTAEREREREAAREEKRAAKDEKREALREAREELAEKKRAAVKAVSKYKGVTIYKRGDGSFFASLDPDSEFESLRDVKAVVDHFKNPAANYSAWSHAVGVLRGEIEGSPRRAAAMIRSTPPGRRLTFLKQSLEKLNPPYSGSGIPTFKQYAWAVSQHCLGRDSHCGAHDEGGAIIHATPEAKRRQYATQIADMKTKRGRSADDARWD